MCQQICLEILEKKNQWMTSREIQEQAKHISLGSIRRNMKQLTKHKIVEMKETTEITKKKSKHPVNKYKAKKK